MQVVCSIVCMGVVGGLSFVFAPSSSLLCTHSEGLTLCLCTSPPIAVRLNALQVDPEKAWTHVGELGEGSFGMVNKVRTYCK